jgi:selenocysteine lyase/cysteine desulfurase
MLNPVYRAVVVYSDSSTGEIIVRIPALSGFDSAIAVSKIGRTAYNGVWQVPAIGSQIVVTADDHNLTNVFWLQVNPDAPTSLTEVETDIDNLSSSLTALTSRVSSLESYRDATFLGIFN